MTESGWTTVSGPQASYRSQEWMDPNLEKTEWMDIGSVKNTRRCIPVHIRHMSNANLFESLVFILCCIFLQ